MKIRSMGFGYVSIVTIGSIGIFMEIVLERLLQATGQSMYPMVTKIVGAVTNIILDPIMIFGLLGFPKMGVAGAALATVIGQIFSMALGLYYNVKKNPYVKIKTIKDLKPDVQIIKQIYKVEGTILKPKSWLSLYRHNTYVPIGNAVAIINAWQSQGANIIYCTSRKKKRAENAALLLNRLGFSGTFLVAHEKKKQIATWSKLSFLIF